MDLKGGPCVPSRVFLKAGTPRTPFSPAARLLFACGGREVSLLFPIPPELKNNNKEEGSADFFFEARRERWRSARYCLLSGYPSEGERMRRALWGGGSEHGEKGPSDKQDGADHAEEWERWRSAKCKTGEIASKKPSEGFEPPTYCLLSSCSAN